MKYKGLFIGLTTIDIQYFVDYFPVSNKKIKTKPPEILVGGPATNAAVAFSYLNNSASLASAFGENSFKSYLKDDFKNVNIDYFDLVKNKTINPVIASVVTASSGERNIFTHNPEKIESSISAVELFNNLEPDILLLDGFYPEFSIDCAQIANNKKIPVILDCGSWKPQYNELLEFADVAICSEDFYPPDCNNSDQVFHFFQEKNVDNIAISRGGESILYFHKKRGEIDIESVKVIDTLGAGDFLHGAFCYYYLQSGNFKLALKKASELASYSCKFGGTRKWLNND
jgi:sugar/nucleoside kinase (ribokinase family)